VTAHPFDAYLANQPQPQRATLQATAATLRALLPAAEECISYGMPAWKVDGTALAGIAGFVGHCSYFPHSGATLDRIAADLGGYDFDAGTLRFPIDRPLPRVLLRKLIAARVATEHDKPIKDGKVHHFYDTGALRWKGTLRNGQRHGEWQFWRKDGSLMRSGRFTAGVQTGTWRTYARDGRLVKETTC